MSNEAQDSIGNDFLYTVSHDLKEPLRGIGILATVLEEDYRGKVMDAGALDLLHRLSSLSARADKMVNELLQFSRLRTTNPVIEKTDIQDLLIDVQRAMQPFLSERKAHIATAPLMMRILCDKGGLATIFTRLIENAVIYNDSSSIRIKIGMENEAYFVSDNGIGIEPQFEKTIFEIFKRTPRSAEYDSEGTGAGLALAKEIIERNGGHIWLKTVPGEGSTFYFTFPSH